MSYKVEALPREPIILVTLSAQSLIMEDMAKSGVEVRALLDQAAEPSFFIMDMSELSVSLDDVIVGANRGARSEQPLSHHPNLREMLFVSRSSMIKLAIKGLNTVTFGNLNARVFDSLDDALAYARSQEAT